MLAERPNQQSVLPATFRPGRKPACRPCEGQSPCPERMRFTGSPRRTLREQVKDLSAIRLMVAGTPGSRAGPRMVALSWWLSPRRSRLRHHGVPEELTDPSRVRQHLERQHLERALGRDRGRASRQSERRGASARLSSRWPTGSRSTYRLPNGRQVQKKLGPAWTQRDGPPAGYFDVAQVIGTGVLEGRARADHPRQRPARAS